MYVHISVYICIYVCMRMKKLRGKQYIHTYILIIYDTNSGMPSRGGWTPKRVLSGF